MGELGRWKEGAAGFSFGLEGQWKGGTVGLSFDLEEEGAVAMGFEGVAAVVE